MQEWKKKVADMAKAIADAEGASIAIGAWDIVFMRKKVRKD